MNTPVHHAQTDPPTEPGWYYAIEEGYTTPKPVEVFRIMGGLLAIGRNSNRNLCFFRWFGAVPEITVG
jgi:hypothetical protein